MVIAILAQKWIILLDNAIQLQKNLIDLRQYSKIFNNKNKCKEIIILKEVILDKNKILILLKIWIK